MLHRIDELFARSESFAVETTLATKIYQQKITAARQQGYTVILLFFWLNNAELAQERVRTRVSEGGHSIKPDVIVRRYRQGIFNLFNNYLPLVDEALIFDNSAGKPVLLAEKIGDNFRIVNERIYSQLRAYYEN